MRTSRSKPKGDRIGSIVAFIASSAVTVIFFYLATRPDLTYYFDHYTVAIILVYFATAFAAFAIAKRAVTSLVNRRANDKQDDQEP